MLALVSVVWFLLNQVLYILQITNVCHLSDEQICILFAPSMACFIICSFYFKDGSCSFTPDINPTAWLRFSTRIIAGLCLIETALPLILFKCEYNQYSDVNTAISINALGCGAFCAWVSAVVFITDREGLFTDKELTVMLCPFFKGGYPAMKRLCNTDFAKMLKDLNEK